MVGTANIVTRRVLDTVSTMPHVTRGQVCVTEAVMPDGVVIHVMKVRCSPSNIRSALKIGFSLPTYSSVHIFCHFFIRDRLMSY